MSMSGLPGRVRRFVGMREGSGWMRGLEHALARIARRDELRERASVTRRPDDTSVSPVVDEVADALRAVVERNPGVFATVVVQEAETAWSVWIGEWDGTLHTRVTTLDPEPSVADLDALDQPTQPLTTPALAEPAAQLAAAQATTTQPAAAQATETQRPAAQEVAIPLPRRKPSRRPVSAADRPAAALPAGPARKSAAAPIAELLRPRYMGSSANADTPPLGVRPPQSDAEELRLSPLADPAAPLPKRFPDSGIPLPRRRPAKPADAPLDQSTIAARPMPALPAVPASVGSAITQRLPVEPEDTTWPPHYQPSHRVERAAHRAQPQGALPVPTIPAPPLAAAQRVSGPAMNDRVANRIAEMLRREAGREAKRDNRGVS
jgi:hypothetical protein